MYKIGEFSKITSLTIKALRYYEEQEILCPSERDKNGYRLYNDQDYERARLIALLRGLDSVSYTHLDVYKRQSPVWVRRRLPASASLFPSLP